jgi:hypothetical protein
VKESGTVAVLLSSLGCLVIHTPQALIITAVTLGAAIIPVVGTSAVVLSAAALLSSGALHAGDRGSSRNHN